MPDATGLFAAVGAVLFVAYVLYLLTRDEDVRVPPPPDYTPPALRRDWLDR